MGPDGFAQPAAVQVDTSYSMLEADINDGWTPTTGASSNRKNRNASNNRKKNANTNTGNGNGVSAKETMVILDGSAVYDDMSGPGGPMDLSSFADDNADYAEADNNGEGARDFDIVLFLVFRRVPCRGREHAWHCMGCALIVILCFPACARSLPFSVCRRRLRLPGRSRREPHRDSARAALRGVLDSA